MSQFIYLNLNIGSNQGNKVGAYGVDSSNNPFPLVPSIYPTEGFGSNDTILGIQSACLCDSGPYLYVINPSDLNHMSVSGFQINPSNGALTLLFSPPISTNGDTIPNNGSPGAILCSPNQQFLYSVNIGSSNITCFNIEAGGNLSQNGPLFSVPSGSLLTGSIITPDGNFLLVCYFNHPNVGVFAIANDGTLSFASLYTDLSGNSSISLASTGDGEYIFIAQGSAITTVTIDSLGNLTFQSVISGYDSIVSIAISSDNQYLYAADHGTSTFISFNIVDGNLIQKDQLSVELAGLVILNQYCTLAYIIGNNFGNSLLSSIPISNGNIGSPSSESPITIPSVSVAGIVTFPPEETICFLEGTKILCYYHNKEIYLPVEQLTARILVKTFKNGYLPINFIGSKEVYHCERNPKLYQCSRNKYPELIENLVITGGHGILIDELTEKQRNKINKIFVTDGKYRLFSKYDERSKPYGKKGLFKVYHFSLENRDKNRNYGVYANGLLVESCFEDTIKLNMKII